jgi:hypothetical protein
MDSNLLFLFTVSTQTAENDGGTLPLASRQNHKANVLSSAAACSDLPPLPA